MCLQVNQFHVKSPDQGNLPTHVPCFIISSLRFIFRKNALKFHKINIV
jgi:hypothetical protein